MFCLQASNVRNLCLRIPSLLWKFTNFFLADWRVILASSIAPERSQSSATCCLTGEGNFFFFKSCQVSEHLWQKEKSGPCYFHVSWDVIGSCEMTDILSTPKRDCTCGPMIILVAIVSVLMLHNFAMTSRLQLTPAPEDTNVGLQFSIQTIQTWLWHLAASKSSLLHS